MGGGSIPEGTEQIGQFLVNPFNHFCLSEMDSISKLGALRIQEESVSGFVYPSESSGSFELEDVLEFQIETKG